MSLKFRRILYSFFIILFLIITPLVIFYAAGYKFSLTGGRLQKTGALILDTKPRGAKIYLNEQPQQTFFKKYILREKSFITTPAKIKNLLPGEYDIKFELDNYWSWQKKLTVQSGASTYAEDVYLFKKDIPTLVMAENIGNIQLSPDRNKIAVFTDEKIIIFNLGNERQTELSNIPVLSADRLAGSQQATPNIYSWAPSSKKIVVNKSIINVENSKKIDLTDYIRININHLKWDVVSDDKLYYQNKNKINSFALATKNNKTIFQNQSLSPTSKYLIKNNNLYLINQQVNSNSLNVHNLDSNDLIRKINIPGSANYQFINIDYALLNLYDADHRILYLIDPLTSFYSPLRETINNVVHTFWVSNNKLLYANDFEIWLYDLEYNQKKLLTRISDTIKSIHWHPSNNYIIYSTNTSINTIELDQREKYNITEVIKLDKIANPVLNQKGDIIYFSSQIGNQQGLYKLAIH